MRNMANIIDIAAVDSAGTGSFRGFSFAVRLGQGGISSAKREGDGKTPLGLFALRRVLWRADRLARPETALPLQPIARDDGWCDAPLDPSYNRYVRLPYGASAEPLWRADRLYDILLIIGFNDDPPTPYWGSAIFVHLTHEDNRPTEGCIALDPNDMLKLLAAVDLETQIEIKRA